MAEINSGELLEAARDNLLAYCGLQNENYAAPNHLIKIAQALEAVERGEIKRLIITVPPRHGKSMLVSQYFPAWFLGRNPNKYIITATYGQDLSSDFGGKVRDQVKDSLFHAVFPGCRMKQDTKASNKFSTERGGTYYAVGAGGAITGRGAHVLLIDDPIKNREEADSLTIRNKVIDWYRSTAYTRLMPNGAVIIVMTRWHEEDLVGFVLKEQAHENWVKIDLPAIDNGKALWPEAYPVEALNNIKASIGDYEWQCLYLQNPISREGQLCRAEWLRSGLPDDIAMKFMAVDPAISKKETADETAFVVCGVDFSNPCKIFEIESVKGKFDFPELIMRGEELYKKHKPVLVGVESVAFQKAIGDVWIKMGLPCAEMKADKDKVRRFLAVSHYLSQGRVHVNSEDLRNQLLRFRGIDDDKDDLVDALVHCLKLIYDNSSESYERSKEDRYKGLDPASKRFWQTFDKEIKGGGDSVKDVNMILG